MEEIIGKLARIDWGFVSKIMTLIAFVFLINLPFGYWRQKCRKFSVTWFLAIHIPVPFIYFARNTLGVPFLWIPVLIPPFWGGQRLGGAIRIRKVSSPSENK